MGTTLTGTTPATTYDSLIKVTDNGPLSGTLKTLTDGLGNDSALALSTGAVSVAGNLTASGASSAFTGGALEIQGTVNAVKTFYINRYGVATGSQHIIRSANAHLLIETANSEPIVLSGGNVGIGNTAPDVSLAVGNTASTVNVPAMKIFRGGATSHTVTYGYSGNAIVNAAGTDYVMQREGTEVARFTAAGLCFGGDYLAANALDDYEEGTFTPTFEPASGAYATLTYGTNIGKYTKIGNRVDFSLRVSLSAYSAGTASGLLRLSGLPFNCVASYVGSVSFSLVDDFAANRYPIKGFINDTASYILLRYMTALNTNEDYVNATDITATTTLRISGTYFTA